MTRILTPAEFSTLLRQHVDVFVIDHDRALTATEAKACWENGEGVHVLSAIEGCFGHNPESKRGKNYYIAELPAGSDPELKALFRANVESRLPWKQK